MGELMNELLRNLEKEAEIAEEDARIRAKYPGRDDITIVRINDGCFPVVLVGKIEKKRQKRYWPDGNISQEDEV